MADGIGAIGSGAARAQAARARAVHSAPPRSAQGAHGAAPKKVSAQDCPGGVCPTPESRFEGTKAASAGAARAKSSAQDCPDGVCPVPNSDGGTSKTQGGGANGNANANALATTGGGKAQKGGFLGGLTNFFNNAGKFADKIGPFFDKLQSQINPAIDAVKQIGTGVKGLFTDFGNIVNGGKSLYGIFQNLFGKPTPTPTPGPKPVPPPAPKSAALV